MQIRQCTYVPKWYALGGRLENGKLSGLWVQSKTSPIMNKTFFS